MGSAREDAATLANAVASLHNNVHYLGAVAQMARQRKVVVVQTVLSEAGDPLLDKGVEVGEGLMELLAQHRLSVPLDTHLSVCTPADVPVLLQEMTRLLAEHPLGCLLSTELGTEGMVLGQALQQMNWPHQASFKMAVMRDQLPSLYEHSLLMAMVAVFLAIRAGWDERQCAKVAAAALLHDVGMLYMSTSWTDSDYKLSDRERAHLAAHSITGSTVIKAMRTYPASVEDAVLEHHECMDGSGYPRHLLGEDISLMGRILMVAEVVSAFFGKYSELASERLSLMLRLHRNRFPAEQVAAVLAMLQRESASVVPAPRDLVLSDCHTVATVMQYWASCQRVLPAQWPGQPGGRAMMFVHARMRSLEMSLAEAGAHARQRSDWEQLLDQDPQSAQELGLIYREALWQLESCMDTCLRRWPTLHSDSSTVERALWTWIQSSRKALASGMAASASIAVPVALSVPSGKPALAPVDAAAEPEALPPTAVEIGMPADDALASSG